MKQTSNCFGVLDTTPYRYGGWVNGKATNLISVSLWMYVLG